MPGASEESFESRIDHCQARVSQGKERILLDGGYTDQIRTSVPGVPVSPCLPPHQALKFLAPRQGIASDVPFLEVIPRQDLARQTSRVYTAGPVPVEEFVHTDSRGTKNTATGKFWGGRPYDYANFEGKNPKDNEQMTPAGGRDLYERAVRGK